MGAAALSTLDRRVPEPCYHEGLASPSRGVFLLPTYDYLCVKCKTTYETREGFHAPTAHKCQECGKGTAKRVLTAPLIVFKGSGFYATDSKSKASSKAESDSAPAASSDSASKADAKSDGKGEAKSASTEGKASKGEPAAAKSEPASAKSAPAAAAASSD